VLDREDEFGRRTRIQAATFAEGTSGVVEDPTVGEDGGLYVLGVVGREGEVRPLGEAFLPAREAVARGAVIRPPAPNPFRSTTTIQYQLARPGEVTISIFDVNGRFVRRMGQDSVAAGWHTITWDGRRESGDDVPDGMYFVIIDAAGASSRQRVTRLTIPQ